MTWPRDSGWRMVSPFKLGTHTFYCWKNSLMTQQDRRCLSEMKSESKTTRRIEHNDSDRILRTVQTGDTPSIRCFDAERSIPDDAVPGHGR